MKIFALLPMKGNSERVPNKNMKPFGGGVLYHAIADKLLKSKYIKQLVIDSDSEVIAKDAMDRYGNMVRIIKRPIDIRGDYVSMNKIIKHDIGQLDGEHFIQTHSTNPLLRIETIDQAIEKYFSVLERGFDSLFSVTRLHTRLYDERARPVNHNPSELRRTQDLAPLFEENSNFYIFSRKGFEKSGFKRIGIKPALHEVNKLEAIDIDEEEDFLLAELMHTYLKM